MKQKKKTPEKEIDKGLLQVYNKPSMTLDSMGLLQTKAVFCYKARALYYVRNVTSCGELTYINCRSRA